jgi:hypothetical protein
MSTASSLSGANLTLGRIYELHGHSHANLIMSPTLSQKIDAGHGRKIAGSVADGARERDDRGLALGDGVEIAHEGLPSVAEVMRSIEHPAHHHRALPLRPACASAHALLSPSAEVSQWDARIENAAAPHRAHSKW